MRTRNFLIICFLIAAVVVIQSCKHEPPLTPVTNNTPIDTDQPCSPDSVYFEADILPIFLSNCAMSGCHDAATAQEGVRLTDYMNIMNTADVRPGNLGGSDLYEVITEHDPGDRMPPEPNQPLEQDKIDLIAKWIMQGAQNKRCFSCDTNNISFSTGVWPIINKNCVGCHKGDAPGAGILLTDYNNIKTATQSGKLYGAITHETGFSPMPKADGNPKLSDCRITSIRKWIEAGMPNN